MTAPLPQAEPAQEPMGLTLLQAMRATLYDTLPTPDGNAESHLPQVAAARERDRLARFRLGISRRGRS